MPEEAEPIIIDDPVLVATMVTSGVAKTLEAYFRFPDEERAKIRDSWQRRQDRLLAVEPELVSSFANLSTSFPMGPETGTYSKEGAAVGAVVGAVIGGIAGGLPGAALGATIGGSIGGAIGEHRKFPLIP